MKIRAHSHFALLAMISFSILPAAADGEATINTSTVQTIETQNQPPVVLNSYMKPVYSRTKEVSSGAETEKVVEPMIMERHETVAIPGSESTRTTVQTEKTVMPTTVIKSQSRAVLHPRRAFHTAHKRTQKSYVAMRSSKASEKIQKIQTVTRTTVNEERSVRPTRIIDQKDPALDNN